MEGAPGPFLEILLPLLLLALGWLVGTSVERAHLRSLRLREIRWRDLPAVSLRATPEDWRIGRSGMVDGSVVISIDYWKRSVAMLRSLFGGRIPAYESLLERARREAVLRMKEAAHEQGFHGVFGVRLETAKLASTRRDGEGTAGVEILAFGTGVERAR